MNRIVGLKRQDGNVCENFDEDKAEVQAFYQNLYTFFLLVTKTSILHKV